MVLHFIFFTGDNMLNKRIYLLVLLAAVCIFAAGFSVGNEPESAAVEAVEVETEKEEEAILPRREAAASDSVALEVPNILQFPELPSGCEITSAAMVLNYLGIPTEKTELIDYLDMDGEYIVEDGMTSRASYWEKFVGDPRTDCYGCTAPVIHKMIDRFLQARGVSEDFRVYSFVSADTSEVYNELMRGNPVIVWATICMSEPYYLETWKVKGKNETLDWYAEEHCTVLAGFDNAAGTVSLSDPYSGVCTYPKELFEKRMEQMNSQYVVIEKLT